VPAAVAHCILYVCAPAAGASIKIHVSCESAPAVSALDATDRCESVIVEPSLVRLIFAVPSLVPWEKVYCPKRSTRSPLAGVTETSTPVISVRDVDVVLIVVVDVYMSYLAKSPSISVAAVSSVGVAALSASA